MASAREPPEEVPSSIAPCWRASRAYAGITPALRQQPPEGGCIYSPSGRPAAKGGRMRLFCGQRQPPSGGCFAREVCEPHVDSLSFVNMGLLKRQPPPEVNLRRKHARVMCRRENLRSEARRRHEKPGERHGGGERPSGGGSIFNNPVLASIASLRGDKPRSYGNNPRRVVASTR